MLTLNDCLLLIPAAQRLEAMLGYLGMEDSYAVQQFITDLARQLNQQPHELSQTIQRIAAIASFAVLVQSPYSSARWSNSVLSL